MIVKRNSLAFKLFLRMPMWLPFYVERTRVGSDTTNYIVIGWRFFR